MKATFSSSWGPRNLLNSAFFIFFIHIICIKLVRGRVPSWNDIPENSGAWSRWSMNCTNFELKIMNFVLNCSKPTSWLLGYDAEYYTFFSHNLMGEKFVILAGDNSIGKHPFVEERIELTPASIYRFTQCLQTSTGSLPEDGWWFSCCSKMPRE